MIRQELVDHFNRMTPAQKKKFKFSIEKITQTATPFTLQDIPSILTGKNKQIRLYQNDIRKLVSGTPLQTTKRKILQQRTVLNLVSSFLDPKQLIQFSQTSTKQKRGIQEEIIPKIISIHSKQIKNISEFLRVLPRFHNLKELNLSWKKMSEKEQHLLGKALSHLEKLETLILSSCQLSSPKLIQSIGKRDTLKHLDLSLNPTLPSKELESNFVHLSHLQILNLHGISLENISFENVSTHLVELDLSKTKLTIDSLESIPNIPKLSKLSLDNLDWGEEEWIRLLPVISKWTNLQNLHLNGNKFESLRNIEEWKNLRSLEMFTLNANKIQAIGAMNLSSVVPFWKNLRVLGLSCNKLGSEGCEFLQLPSSLLSLYLNDNNIQDRGAIFLQPKLAKLKKLEDLFLDKNQISDEGIVYLCQILVHLPKLQMISLKQNNIMDRGAQYLGNLLFKKPSIFFMDLQKNPISARGKNVLLSYFSHRLDI